MNGTKIVKLRLVMNCGIVGTILSFALGLSLWGAEPGASSQLAENLRKGKSQHLVVYGTSLCTPQYSAWVSQSQALIEAGFPKLCTVTNSAQAGAASNWGLDNIDTRVIALKPDTVLIEFSINDGYTIVLLEWEKLFTENEKKWHLVVPDNVHPTKEGNELVTTPTIVKALFGSEKVR